MKKKFLSVLFALVLVLSFSLIMAVPVMAGDPTIALTTGGGIDSLTGVPTGSGTEAGVHSIEITDATACILTGVVVEDGVTEGNLAIALTGDETLTLTIGGVLITTGMLTASTTLVAAAATVETEINAATTTPNIDVAVSVTDETGASNGYLVITVNLAGVLNSITGSVTGAGGGETETGLSTGTLVAGTDADAVDTLAAATGSNDLWVTANGASKTITHTTTAGTASTLAGLKPLVIVADAFIEGITLAASGVLSAGTATVTVTAGTASLLAITTQPDGSVSGVALTTQPVVEAQDDSGNVDLTYTTDVVASEDDAGALTGTTTKAAVAGVATFDDLLYTATADTQTFQIDFVSSGITGVTSGDVVSDVVATAIELTTAPASVISGVSMTTPVVSYVDGNGVVDEGIDADVVTATENGAGTVAGDTATATDGVATFTALIYTAVADGEAVTFTFTDDGAGLDLSGVPVDSSALTADVVAIKLELTTAPGSIISGVSMTQPVVTYVDEQNTTDTGITTDVITITEDGVGSLAGTTTATAALGVATFDDLVYTALADSESVTFTFTDDTSGAKDFSGVPVDSGALTADVEATKLVIVTQPAGAVSGVALVIRPVINAVDADDTLDTGWTTECAVARETGTGTVTGGPVSPMSAGVATFTDVTVTESPVVYGSYTLEFTSTALVAVVSDTFKVYDKVLDLNDNAWTLISTDNYVISSSGDDTSAFEGAVSLKYIYTGSSYVPATVDDIEPVEALYVKTTSDDGCLGLNYSTIASPGASNKSLLAGWNLVSSATSTASNAGPVLSPLQYVDVGEEQGVGLATLVSQGSYNLTSTDFYIDATTWSNLASTTLDAFDGYWVYMNAAKSFGVIPQ